MKEKKKKDVAVSAMESFDTITAELETLLKAGKDSMVKISILQGATHAVFHQIVEAAPSGLQATKFIVGELDHMLEHQVEQQAEELLEEMKEDILEETAASGTMH